MKKLLFLLIFCLTTTITIGQSVVYDTIQYAKKYHQKRLTLFKSEPIVKGKTIFLGDSNTEFADWQKLLNDATVINRGIAGDNTFGVLARLDDVINREPEKLFIKIGINDISQNIPTDIIVKNITAIIQKVKVKSPSTKIYVHSILPTNDNVKNEYPAAYNKNNIVSSVNSQIQKLSAKYNVTYVDINKIFSDKYGKLDLKYATPDGLHLNELGYKTWVEFLRKNKYL
ncbi:GDSL-type esterase/lipase family protein [Flavobacterium aestivum]|uniref:GDSL-type esterase/lipase family protein n=1 Tax=Flavobacterium aestivum TaxID=3003257 RepID=UPI0022866557|nr:GDSL-type esterase/lipase family protein [Flavobacterium aestivum]